MSIRKWMWFVVIVLVASISAWLNAATWYVKAGGTNGNGQSFTTPFNNLASGLAAAQSGDQVWVAEGTYVVGVPSDPNPRTKTYSIPSNVKVYAGFEWLHTESFNDRDIDANPCILSGDINGDDDPGDPDTFDDNAYHVVTMYQSQSNTLLDGFTITAGNAVGAPANETGVVGDAGGGAFIISWNGSGSVEPCTPNLVRCTFEANRATRGGAVFVCALQNSPIDFYNCVFRNNFASSDGGALYAGDNNNVARKSSSILVNCLFHDNAAQNNGSAIFCEEYPGVTLKYCTVTQNVAGGTVGAVHSQGGSGVSEGGVTIVSSILWDNLRQSTVNDGLAQLSAANRSVKYSCVTAYTNQGADTGNTTSDPLFVNAGAENFRLSRMSPCIGNGTPSDQYPGTDFPPDVFDVNQDTDVAEVTPDLDRLVRIECPNVDMGGYEFFATGCYEDANGDGVVGIADLLLVIGAWGPCPGSFCAADIDPYPCGDGDIGISDLLAVIGAWGCHTSSGGGEEMPESIEDCMEIADLAFERNTPEWFSAYEKCVTKLCQDEIIDCD